MPCALSEKPVFAGVAAPKRAPSALTVRFMKLRNFFSISVMMEKSPLGRCSRTQVTFICGGRRVRVRLGLGAREWSCCTSAVRRSHLAALAEAAQQQSRVGGHDAVLHVFARVLQSCSAHTGRRSRVHHLTSSHLKTKLRLLLVGYFLLYSKAATNNDFFLVG